VVRILLTGFEPFAGEHLNPSGEVVRRLAEEPPAGIDLHTRILPVERGRAAALALDGVAAVDPAAVLMLGEAGGRACVTPERVAVNVEAFRIPDNAGQQPRDEPVVAGGPVGYFSTLPVRLMVERLRDAGVPAEISDSAGTYVCNSTFYALMHAVGTQRRAGFVHLPYAHEQVHGKPSAVPSLSMDSLVRACCVLLETLRDTGPR